jgi:tetratricopeptide (TPR) repeat protein
VGFFALWSAITILPTNSVIALDDLVCDRWLYLSSVGYAVLLALTVDWIFQKRIEQGSRTGKIVFFFLCALVIELYGFSTLLRNFDWTSQRTLWEDAVAKSPNKARPYNGLGLALVLQDRLEEASKNFHQAITLEPKGGQPYLNLGYVYSLQGDLDKSIEYYEKAIPLSPKLLSEIYNNLGLTYLKQNKMEESEKYLRNAIEIRPHNAAPHSNLGLFFETRGDIDQAISCQEKANKLDPDNFLPYEALSRLYKKKDGVKKARRLTKIS